MSDRVEEIRARLEHAAKHRNVIPQVSNEEGRFLLAELDAAQAELDGSQAQVAAAAKMLNNVAAAEREACAQIAESWDHAKYPNVVRIAVRRMSSQIRQRNLSASPE